MVHQKDLGLEQDLDQDQNIQVQEDLDQEE
jgi:hypothetical protein